MNDDIPVSKVEDPTGRHVSFKDEYGDIHTGIIQCVTKERGSDLYLIIVENTMFMVPEESIV